MNATTAASGQPLLVAEKVKKIYRSGDVFVPALVDLDPSVGAGELVTVMGRSGSGKTTLLNCLSGLDDIDGGRVTAAGRDLFAMSDAESTEHRTRGRAPPRCGPSPASSRTAPRSTGSARGSSASPC